MLIFVEADRLYDPAGIISYGRDQCFRQIKTLCSNPRHRAGYPGGQAGKQRRRLLGALSVVAFVDLGSDAAHGSPMAMRAFDHNMPSCRLPGMMTRRRRAGRWRRRFIIRPRRMGKSRFVAGGFGQRWRLEKLVYVRFRNGDGRHSHRRRVGQGRAKHGKHRSGGGPLQPAVHRPAFAQAPTSATRRTPP